MQGTKNLVQEALIQMKNVEEVIAENAKGILASTMKEEISQLVKESLSEQEDEIEMDADVEMGDIDTDADNDEMDLDLDDEDEMDIDMDMDFDDEEETIDLTNASDEEILKIFKAMGEEDGIMVQKDGNEVHITDSDEDVEYIVKMNEGEQDDIEMEMGEQADFDDMEMEDEDADLDAVLASLNLEGDYSESNHMEDEIEEGDDVYYEIEMSEEDEIEEGDMDMMDEDDSEMMDEEDTEDYDLSEAKMTVKPKGVGMGSPKFKYGKTLPKQGFDDHKKEGPKTMGTGKAKFEFKEGEVEEGKDKNYGSKKHEYKRKDVNGVEKKTGEKDGHYKDYEGKIGGNKGDKSKTHPMKKDYEKTEAKEASRTYGFGSKEGRGLRKGITNNRNYVYGNSGVTVESVEVELKTLREKNEEYRKALNVFREKLNEVAVFNSNLAYATRLFTEHSTTKKEKINILRRFDSVENLKESKNLYKTIKEDLETVNSKNINESVQRSVNNSVSSGSAQNLIESKTYENPQFLRIKDLMSKL